MYEGRCSRTQFNSSTFPQGIRVPMAFSTMGLYSSERLTTRIWLGYPPGVNSYREPTTSGR